MALIWASATFNIPAAERIELQSNDYVIRLHDDPSAIDAAAWYRLLAAQDAEDRFAQDLRDALVLAATAGLAERPSWLTVDGTLRRLYRAGAEMAHITPLRDDTVDGGALRLAEGMSARRLHVNFTREI